MAAAQQQIHVVDLKHNIQVSDSVKQGSLTTGLGVRSSLQDRFMRIYLNVQPADTFFKFLFLLIFIFLQSFYFSIII